MYLPERFAADANTTQQLLATMGAADLVTLGAQGMLATYLPMVYTPDPAPHGLLHGHVSRDNPQWQHAGSQTLVIVHGADAYITPSWYPAKREHGRVVPTWSYLTVHLHGELVVHEDPAWLRSHLRTLTDKHESGEAAPWSIDDAPDDYLERRLAGIVGLEVVVTRIEAKAKLGQNRSAADVAGVVEGLRARGDTALAQAVAEANAARLDVL